MALPVLIAGPLLQYALPLAWPRMAHHGALELVRAGVLYAAALGFLGANARRPGAPLALAGAACNALVTLWAGGRMPVLVSALHRFPPRMVAVMTGGGFGAHAPMAHPSGLQWLGDVIAVPPPMPPEVLSAGDLLIALGFAVFLAAAMLGRGDRGKGPPWPPPPRSGDVGVGPV